jgi:hypothetical protein
MTYHFVFKKVNYATNELFSTYKLTTDSWKQVEKYWVDSGLYVYEDVDHARKDIEQYGTYSLYCDANYFTGDGFIILVVGSTNGPINEKI